MKKTTVTYSERRGKAPFDWHEFLNRKSYSRKELNEAVELSVSWITCACGNQCDVIPRDYDGKPFDDKLERLGFNFYMKIKEIRNVTIVGNFENIENNLKNDALKLLMNIERRSATLIRKIKKEEGGVK